MKFKIIGFFLIAVIFLGGCSGKKVELKTNNENKKVDGNQEEQVVAKEEFQNSFKYQTIQDLLDQEKDLECYWRIEKAEVLADADEENVNEDASGGIEEGRIFLKEGDFFQEIQITENSRKTVIKTLKNGDWFYQWNSLVADQGVKMLFARAKDSEFLKINKVYDWNCQKFSGSEDVFQVPEGIRFLNF